MPRRRFTFSANRRLQVFRLRDNGQVELEGSGLCLVAGPKSAPTFSAEHRWRALYLDESKTADPARSRWKFSIPKTTRPG